MRVFLIWADKGPLMKNLMEKLRDNSHEVMYWVGSGGGEKDKTESTIYHDFGLALGNIPPKEFSLSDFPPPDDCLIKKMYRTESIVLTMMNKRYDKMGMDERKHLYYNMLGYWHGIINKFKPEAIIFSDIPHSVFNYIIYDLAKLLRIKTFMFDDTLVHDRALYYNDFWQGSVALQEEIEKNQGKNYTLEDLSPDLQEYYKLQTEAGCDATPFYRKKDEQIFSLKNRIFFKIKKSFKYLKDFSLLRRASIYVYKSLSDNLQKEYKSVQTEPDFNKKYIYAPLNYQPESTTCPQGDMFVDQILMIEILSAALPEDWVIYVKEHPTQIYSRGINYFSSRYRGYYRKIASLKNVYLIPIGTDTFTLLNKSQAVATVTGTAGWEAAFRLKPALIFGYPRYRDCPGLFKVRSVASCQKAIKEIRFGFKITKQEIINYLKCFDKATVHGYIDTGIAQSSKFNREQSMDNLIKIIIKELKK